MRRWNWQAVVGAGLMVAAAVGCGSGGSSADRTTTSGDQHGAAVEGSSTTPGSGSGQASSGGVPRVTDPVGLAGNPMASTLHGETLWVVTARDKGTTVTPFDADTLEPNGDPLTITDAESWDFVNSIGIVGDHLFGAASDGVAGTNQDEKFLVRLDLRTGEMVRRDLPEVHSFQVVTDVTAGGVLLVGVRDTVASDPDAIAPELYEDDDVPILETGFVARIDPDTLENIAELTFQHYGSEFVEDTTGAWVAGWDGYSYTALTRITLDPLTEIGSVNSEVEGGDLICTEDGCMVVGSSDAAMLDADGPTAALTEVPDLLLGMRDVVVCGGFVWGTPPGDEDEVEEQALLIGRQAAEPTREISVDVPFDADELACHGKLMVFGAVSDTYWMAAVEP